MTSQFTLSREDFFDYSRCPKIVAIKSYRKLHPVTKLEIATRKSPETPPAVIGKIGEAAVAVAFSELASEAETTEELVAVVAHQTQRKVVDMGVAIDENAKRILSETAEGVSAVRERLVHQYGDVQIIGRGGCRNGPFPGEALPDYVAVSPKNRQPILIEVKNSLKPAIADRFQASFYNTVVRETGVVVHEQRFESGKLNLVPVAYHESVADTILVYPRGSTYERVANQVDLRENTIKRIWAAKQLGFMGKSPETGCDSKCPHHRFGAELPEGDLEPAVPLALIFAQGLVENEVDLDARYLHSYFHKTGLGSEMFEWILKASTDLGLKNEIVERMSSRTGLRAVLLDRMIFGREEQLHSERVLKTMSGDLEPWEKILGKEQTKGLAPTLQGLVTRLYSLPDDSECFIDRSRKKWRD